MSDKPGTSSSFLSKIQLRLERNHDPKYVPESQCIFCLSKGTKAKPLSSTENGRNLIIKVGDSSKTNSVAMSFLFFNFSSRTRYSMIVCITSQAAEIRHDETIKSRICLAPETFQYHAKEYSCYRGYVHQKNLDIESSKRKRNEPRVGIIIISNFAICRRTNQSLINRQACNTATTSL